MSSQSQIRVQFDDFATAVSQLPKMKRAPRSVAGSIPSDTLLTADREGVLVETSALSSLVNSDKPWTFNASVNAKRLIEVCSGLKRIGAARQAIDVDIQDRYLWLSFGTTKVSLPTLWVK